MMAMVMKMMMTMVVAPPTIQRLPYPSVPACDKLQHRATGGHDADLSIKLNGHCSCAAHYFVRIPHTSSGSRSKRYSAMGEVPLVAKHCHRLTCFGLS